MKRLCDDLMIPTDNSLDDDNYGSRYITGLTYSYRRDQREDFKNILKEIEPSDNFPDDHNDGPSQKNHRYEMARHSSLSKSNNLDLNDAEHDWLEDKQCDYLNSDHNNVKKCTNSQHTPKIITAEKSDAGKVPDIEGYFSDFTNDTENDIEEEFDFD